MDEEKVEQLDDLFNKLIKQRFYKEFVAYDQLGIHPGQSQMIRLLHNYPGKSQKWIADHICIKPATMTIIIKKLEKAEIVQRIPDERDKRVLRVNLTEKGQELFLKLDKIKRKLQEECFRNFNDEEIDVFYNLLIKMEKNVSNYSDEAVRRFMEHNGKYD